MQDSERISSKLLKFHPSLTLELKRRAADRRERGLPVYDFGLGETQGELPRIIREAGEQAYREGRTMYGDPAGLPELREAVLEWLGLAGDYGVENVVITAGAKQSLFNIFLAACNPADCVLLDAAPWVSYQPLAVASYAVPIMVLPQDKGARRLKVTAEDLARNIRMRPHVKLFLLNNPVNPTAQLYDLSEVEALLKVCVENQIYFVVDRLYWRILFDGRRYPELVIDDQTKKWLVYVDGLSKNFRRTGGLRIGWSLSPPDLARAMINLQSHYTSGPAIPTQYSALAAITHAYDPEMVNDLEAKRDLLQREGKALPGVDVWPTDATFYSFWDVHNLFGKRTPDGQILETSDDVARYLAEGAGVMTASGSWFMQEGYLRITFAASDEQITGGVRAAVEALGALTN